MVYELETIAKNEQKMLAYLGHFRTPSSVSMDSGGLVWTVIPNFSVAIDSALIAAGVERTSPDLAVKREYERGVLLNRFEVLVRHAMLPK